MRNSGPHGTANTRSRRAFLVETLAATAAATLAFGSYNSVAGAEEQACCPTRLMAAAAPPAQSLAGATAGNQQAMDLAKRSARVMDANDAVMALAQALTDPALRSATLQVLQNPAPTYQLRSPSRADKEAVRQELLGAGLISDQVTVEGIFPPVPDPHLAPQAFWSAPGSTYAGHHAYVDLSALRRA